MQFFINNILMSVVLASHLVWVVLLLGGSAFALSHQWYRPINAAVGGSTIVSQILFLGCPLTALQESLRSYGKDEIEGFQGGFVAYYLDEVLGVSPSEMIILVGTYLLFAFSLALLISWFIHRRKEQTIQPAH